MKKFIQLLSVSVVGAALVGCSFNGRIPSSRAEYPDTVARGYSSLELVDKAMFNGESSTDWYAALAYKLQASNASDPAYGELKKISFENDNVIKVQIVGQVLRDVATCTAFNIGVEMINSPRPSAAPREVVRQAGYTVLNDPDRGYMIRPPRYTFPSDCLNNARNQVPPPPGGWIARIQ